MAGLLKANCKITHEGHSLGVVAPGIERLFALSDIPTIFSTIQSDLFDDRLWLRFEENRAVFAMRYFTDVQIALHLLITALFLLGRTGPAEPLSLAALVTVFFAAHLVPVFLKGLVFFRLSGIISKTLSSS